MEPYCTDKHKTFFEWGIYKKLLLNGPLEDVSYEYLGQTFFLVETFLVSKHWKPEVAFLKISVFCFSARKNIGFKISGIFENVCLTRWLLFWNPIPASFSVLLSFLCHAIARLSDKLICQCWDSNRRSMVSVATTMPTAPKPLLKMIAFCGPLTGTIKQILHPYITEEITKKNSQNIT